MVIVPVPAGKGTVHSFAQFHFTAITTTVCPCLIDIRKFCLTPLFPLIYLAFHETWRHLLL